MTWQPFYVGDGTPRDVDLGEPPPWRSFPRQALHKQFQPPPGLVRAVNAALMLRRPLLVTGAAGSGKSTVIEQVAAELKLGDVLRWHITSRSTLAEALYRYDALGRIHAQRLAGRDSDDDIAPFLQLGPLGTALLPAEHPRALLIDEIDKSDLDLPSDLLDVLERGEFEITELARYASDLVDVREWGSDVRSPVTRGRVQCDRFPFIVMTSNGERDFPQAFLRRCIRFTMPKPTVDALRRIVDAHLRIGPDADGTQAVDTVIQTFVDRVAAGESLAIDQLLNAVHLLTVGTLATGEDDQEVMALVLRELSRA
ncbi:AAA family ATPase [Streptomyces griseiscabiei]|uniref:MoxR family ATPase n=1 Tax=Streptomyces griseiscabiei TaxID=2993540 RepID=A0ABU4L4H8_9ACTN|nr:MoxR family ATPase [Streptomyces griseiscabiei]MBZ3905483.1 ATPase [Streptomyces griseiscabiei]MDX2910574.1 MoxR family ATPase [Streptomyces griseiscabiei]